LTALDFPDDFKSFYSPDLVASVAALATNHGSRIHGPVHWASVQRFGEQLVSGTPGADPDVVRLFALLHDAMRENDGHDPDHGPRAASLALELFDLLGLSERQFRLLTAACEAHDRGLVSDDPTIGCCWDSDRLDLPRVGTIPNPRFFSTRAGREAAERLSATR
jgi:uncharacterized protein